MLEKLQFIRDFKPKEAVETLVLVKHIARVEARDGKSYLNAVLSDSSGDVEARKWQGVERVVDELSRGDYAKVKGKINLYQNRIQLIIKEIEKVDEDKVDKNQFIVQSKESGSVMFEKLISLVDGLDDVYIRDLLREILFDREIERCLKIWPAGRSIHHAYQGGLLEHILSCSELALLLSPRYQCNPNYVLAGAALHDLCKIYELTPGPLVDYTEEGQLVGHLLKGIELLDHFCNKIPHFPKKTKMHLKHILLAHHGALEYGSPKRPQTVEAHLVHLIDLMDSRMNAVTESIKNDTLAGKWTAFIKHMDRVLFKEELPHHPNYLEEHEHPRPPPSNSKDGKGKELKNKDLAKQLAKLVMN